MAKIRELKKEVNYLTFEVIEDCNTFISYHPDKKDDAIKLIENAVKLRNELIKKINHPAEVSNKYFKEIETSLITGADEIFEKLRKLIS
jgi:phosphosulfolactate synthase (CoM biosynthesis protein A)